MFAFGLVGVGAAAAVDVGAVYDGAAAAAAVARAAAAAAGAAAGIADPSAAAAAAGAAAWLLPLVVLLGVRAMAQQADEYRWW